jgi:hypothetical protein
MTYEEQSLALVERLARTTPEELPDFFSRERERFITADRPFGAYFRRKLREKGILQQNVFLAADLGENYGYKLLSEEKHTRRRDVILRLCLGARFTPEEIREALTLYGMAPLYPRSFRDAVFLSAAGSGVFDVHEVHDLLVQNGLPGLFPE